MSCCPCPFTIYHFIATIIASPTAPTAALLPMLLPHRLYASHMPYISHMQQSS